MDNLFLENVNLKMKIVQYRREYLKNNSIIEPTPQEIIKMRRVISSRLKKEINNISKKHKKITDGIFQDSSGVVALR